jgi:uncharacterized membrane protein
MNWNVTVSVVMLIITRERHLLRHSTEDVLYNNSYISFIFLSVLGIELRASHLLGKNFTT